jgi:hypothetical protein
MPNPYMQISNMDTSLQDKLSSVLVLRGADNRQQEMMESYLSSLDLPKSVTK